MMIGIAAEDGPEAAAMIDRGPEALPMSAVLGGLRAPESKLSSPLFYSTYNNLNAQLLVMFWVSHVLTIVRNICDNIINNILKEGVVVLQHFTAEK